MKDFIIDEAFSRKVRLLSFFAACAVVLIHSDVWIGTEHSVSGFSVTNFVCHWMTCWAVPFFFLLSGFWFGRGGYLNGRMGYGPFIRGKIIMLLVPYLLFNAIALLVLAPGKVLANTRLHIPAFWGTPFGCSTLMEALDAFVGVVHGTPFHGHLWYVRALLVLFFFAFLLKSAWRLEEWGWRRFYPRHAECRVLPMLLGVWLLVFCTELWIPYLSLDFSKVSYFFIGMSFSRLDLERIRLRRSQVGVSLLLAFGSALSLSAHAGPFPGGVVLRNLLTFCSVSFWIVAFWFGYDHLSFLLTRAKRFDCSFWIYCTHGLILPFLLAPLRHFGSGTSLWICDGLFLTLAVWTVGVIGSSVAALFVRRLSPRFYSLLTGGR